MGKEASMKILKEYVEYGNIIDIEVFSSDKGKWSLGLYVGDNYYETDPYTRKEYALSEAKGYLEGVKAQLEEALKFIENEIELEVDDEQERTDES